VCGKSFTQNSEPQISREFNQILFAVKPVPSRSFLPNLPSGEKVIIFPDRDRLVLQSGLTIVLFLARKSDCRRSESESDPEGSFTAMFAGGSGDIGMNGLSCCWIRRASSMHYIMQCIMH
jgi:hypothetical protein